MLGVDRLDYTKGIPRRLAAIERLLARDPSLRSSLRYIQIAVPSRGHVDSYQRFRRHVEEHVGRINGTHGTLESLPVHYVHQSVSPQDLVALYCAADVMLVTPLRDGMNLVAHEFVLCQSEPGLAGRWRGALLLSEFAGSAQVLPGALLVNPWNLDSVIDQLGTALELGPRERRRRLETMTKRVEALDCRRWADGFLMRLARNSRRDRRRKLPPFLDEEREEKLTGRFSRARARVVLLDYDGTLVPFTRDPQAAAPDPGLLDLLRRLTGLSRTRVAIVSGRDAATLDAWFAGLDLVLVVEHGAQVRELGGQWTTLGGLGAEVRRRAEEAMLVFTDRLPGSFVEFKQHSVAWHWRGADAEVGALRARELADTLRSWRLGASTKVFSGKRVVEVRSAGAHKGVAALRYVTGRDEEAVLAR